MTVDLSAACHSIFQGVRCNWCTPKVCSNTELACNRSAYLEDAPSPSIQAQLQGSSCYSAVVPQTCLMWECLASIVLRSVSKNPLVHLFFLLITLLFSSNAWNEAYSPFPFFHNVYPSIFSFTLSLFFSSSFKIFSYFSLSLESHWLPLFAFLCLQFIGLLYPW